MSAALNPAAAAEEVDRELAAAWQCWESGEAEDLVEMIDRIVSRLDEPVAAFERASARDRVGRTAEAIPLYRRALQGSLDPSLRRRAVIQLAGAYRILGQADKSLRLLFAERREASEALDDSIEAMLALVLVDLGWEREAAGVALRALAKHLPRNDRSIGTYAVQLALP